MIDVKELIRATSVGDLNRAADDYFKVVLGFGVAGKPFRLPEAKHYLTEVGHLIYGLDIRPGDRVLDFGCGTGWTTRILVACGCEAVGVDVSETALSVARDQADQWVKASLLDGDKISFRAIEGPLPFDDLSFDKIFVLDALHHVPNQAAVLAQFARVLKPGGQIGFCEPGPHHSESPEAQREMEIHAVIENDIVLDDILTAAGEAGLGDCRVCVTPLLPMMVDYAAYRAFPTDASVALQFVNATDWRIKNYPIFFLRKEGVPERDSRSIDGLRGEYDLMSPESMLSPQDNPTMVTLRVRNTGDAIWLPSADIFGTVNFGIMVKRAGERTVQYRRDVSADRVEPGRELEVTFVFPVLQPGSYEVEIDLVSWFVAWFSSLGSMPVTLRVTVP